MRPIMSKVQKELWKKVDEYSEKTGTPKYLILEAALISYLNCDPHQYETPSHERISRVAHPPKVEGHVPLKEFAKMQGVQRQSIYDWIASGRLTEKSVKWSGRWILIHLAQAEIDLGTWGDRRKIWKSWRNLLHKKSVT